MGVSIGNENNSVPLLEDYFSANKCQCQGIKFSVNSACIAMSLAHLTFTMATNYQKMARQQSYHLKFLLLF